MGALIDTKKCDEIYRCNQVKLAVVWITLIGSPISFFLVIFCIYRMVSIKRKMSFLTKIILLIFSSELVMSISKIIQVFKYCFTDYREVKDYDGFNGRALICKIQLVLAVYSDYCSLLATLLLSYRCYDVIKNKNKIFDKPRNIKISLYSIIILSFLLGVGFLIADMCISDISYKFDVRDRCCYWCWLEQGVSIVCFSFYLAILIANIFYACKTINYLKRGYNKLLEENGLSKSKANLEDPLIGKDNKDDINSKVYKNLTNEERKRLEEINLMKIKCKIYPTVTIILWIYALFYRCCEAGFFWEYDHGNNPTETTEKEKEYFESHPISHFVVQFLLVLHTFVTSLRGVFYCASFIVFEEKRFFNIFRRLCHKKIIEFKEENENEIVKDSNCAISSLSDANDNNASTDNKEMNESKELIDRESRGDDNVEMNNTEYHVE